MTQKKGKGQKTSKEVRLESPKTDTPDVYGRLTWNHKDLLHSYEGRQLARFIWLLSGVFIGGCIAFAICIMTPSLGLQSALIVFLLFVLFTSVFVIFFRSWPVVVPGGQYWIVTKPVNRPVRFLEPGWHFIKPIESIRFYRTNELLKIDLSTVPPVANENIPFQLTGRIEFRYNPSLAQPENLDDMLLLTDEDIIGKIQDDLFRIQFDVITQAKRDQLWTEGIPELIDKVEEFLVEKRASGIRAETIIVYLEVPQDVAKAHIYEWAETAKARASQFEMQAYLEATGELPSPEAGVRYRLSSGRTNLRLYGGSNLASLYKSEQQKLPETVVSPKWINVSPADMIIEGSSRRDASDSSATDTTTNRPMSSKPKPKKNSKPKPSTRSHSPLDEL